MSEGQVCFRPDGHVSIELWDCSVGSLIVALIKKNLLKKNDFGHIQKCITSENSSLGFMHFYFVESVESTHTPDYKPLLYFCCRLPSYVWQTRNRRRVVFNESVDCKVNTSILYKCKSTLRKYNDNQTTQQINNPTETFLAKLRFMKTNPSL